MDATPNESPDTNNETPKSCTLSGGGSCPWTRPSGLILLACVGLAIGVLTRYTLLPGETPVGPMVQVSGIVTIDETPLPDALVQVAPKGAPVAQGYTDQEGRFALTTSEEGDGCPTGVHRAAVIPIEDTDEGRSLVPEAYQDLETSPLTVSIDGPTDDLRIDLP